LTQSFVFGVTPNRIISGADMGVIFDCANTPTTVTVSGLNTFLLSASGTPSPDLIAIGATPTGDGILNLPGANGTELFAAAAINIGAAGQITATIDDNGRGLALTAAICQSDPMTAQCVNPPSPGSSATFNAGANQTVTLTMSVTGAGNVPFDPASNRLFVRLKTSDGVTRGATSVAVRTQ
jgi:hypothetical protein